MHTNKLVCVSQGSVLPYAAYILLYAAHIPPYAAYIDVDYCDWSPVKVAQILHLV